MNWLYTGSLPAPSDEAEWAHIGGKDAGSVETKIKAYVFADRFLVPVFRRAINNSLVETVFANACLTEADNILSWAQEAFPNIPPNRPLLQLIVDQHCKHWKDCCERPGSGLKQYPVAFLVRTMRRQSEIIEAKNCRQSGGQRCYYEHANVLRACQ